MYDENNYTYVMYPFFSLRTMITIEEPGTFTYDSFFDIADTGDTGNSTCNFTNGTFTKIIELFASSLWFNLLEISKNWSAQ